MMKRDSNMQEVMIIEDVFELPNLGLVISGNGKSVSHLKIPEIEALISKGIELFSNGIKFPVEVRNLDISSSLVGQVNINIAIATLDKELKVDPGFMVIAKEAGK